MVEKTPKRRGMNARSLRKLDLAAHESQFTEEYLLGMGRALATGRMGVKRLSFTDDIQPGLRALVRESGAIALVCQYTVGDTRPMLKVGELPGSSIDDVRKLCRIILAIAAKGIDVQDGLHERLLRELREQGENWRP